MSKITKEQLEKLNELEQKIAAIKHDIGQLELQKHGLLHAFVNVQEESNKLKKELEDEYGKININLKDGTYEKIEENEQTK
jgi:vacuolar-type H+-ATPase subunit D/Vma8|tara:strand:- start:329 stop:571 length:243 start_codon:yes stop_codon:yes gene_type:complete